MIKMKNDKMTNRPLRENNLVPYLSIISIILKFYHSIIISFLSYYYNFLIYKVRAYTCTHIETKKKWKKTGNR